ncbi:hypothetical protein Tco_0760866 [Tanacetum coccineum]
MVDEFAPPKFFASVRGMEHNQLFTEFNVGSAHQMSLSAEVRMRAEYNIKENRRLKSIIDEQAELLKVRAGEIESLKAQLLLKEVEAAEAISLCAEASKFEAIEKSLQDEMKTLKEYNTTLEKEKNDMDVKVTDLATSVAVRECEVHELEVSSSRLQEKVTVYENSIKQLEKFLDDRMKEVNDKFDKLYADFIEMALHLEERAAIGKDIEKGMQDGLSARITHGVKGRALTDLRSNKDASVDTLTNILRLEETLAERLGLSELQPQVDQLMVPIHHSPDQVILGASSLSLALDVSSTKGTYNVIPATTDTTMALSITFSSASMLASNIESNKKVRPYTPTTVIIPAVPATNNSLAVPERTTEAIKRLQQGESLNIQDVKTNLFWEFGKFTSHDGGTMELYYTRMAKEANELCAERIAKNANLLALVATAQPYQDPYYQASKSHKSYALTSKASLPTRSHATTRHKGKEIAKPITHSSESASKEDSDLEHAQKDKEMEKNLALIAKAMTVAGARETVGGQECKKPKWVKDFTYHKEKMLLCKQAEKGVQLQAEQSDWLADTDEEIDEQELEAHYSYMAKIQEVPIVDSGTDYEPLEQQEMHVDLKYVESLEKEINELESDKAEFSNMYDMLLQECVSNDVMCLYLHLLFDLDAHTKLQCLYLYKVIECDRLAQKLSKQTKSQMKNDTFCKEKASNVFQKEREQYFEIQDLKAQLQDKNIAISELKKLIKKCKGKSVETKFDKPCVVRQPNAQRIPKPSVLGKPTPFSDSLERKNFAKKKSLPKTNESEEVNQRTNVSRPQFRSTQMKDKVVLNTSQVKFKKTEVEDHHRISSISNQSKSVTACNDSLESKTSNVNAICATCGKCVFNSNHDACVSKYLNYVDART